VVWRSEGDHCGWAPLPPHSEFVAGVGWRFNGIAVGVNFDFGLHPAQFTFIALHDFNNHDLGHCRLAPTEVTRIYNHTTIINNYTVNNTTVINQGIKVERVAAATHTEIRKVPVRDVPAGGGRTVPTHTTDHGAPVAYRAELKAPARTSGMVAQKVDERHPVIQHAPVAAAAPRPQHSPTLATAAPAATVRSGTTSAVGHVGTGDVPRNAERTGPAQPPATQRGTQAAVTAPSAPSSPQATRAATEPPGANSQLYPLRTGGHAAPTMPQSSASRQPAAQYYPKSYHQAAEAHALPPLNQYGTAPAAPAEHSSASSSKKKEN
jgi:hypothetical protein